MATNQNVFSTAPDSRGRFGDFGGRFVPETLTFALDQLEAEYEKSKDDSDFTSQLTQLLNDFVGSSVYLEHVRYDLFLIWVIAALNTCIDISKVSCVG